MTPHEYLDAALRLLVEIANPVSDDGMDALRQADCMLLHAWHHGCYAWGLHEDLREILVGVSWCRGRMSAGGDVDPELTWAALRRVQRSIRLLMADSKTPPAGTSCVRVVDCSDPGEPGRPEPPSPRCEECGELLFSDEPGPCCTYCTAAAEVAHIEDEDERADAHACVVHRLLIDADLRDAGVKP